MISECKAHGDSYIAWMMLKIAISKVEKAAEKRKSQSNRGRVKRALLADQDANELQGFANDLRDALRVFRVCDGVFLPGLC